jgi:hypothetical protein
LRTLKTWNLVDEQADQRKWDERRTVEIFIGEVSSGMEGMVEMIIEEDGPMRPGLRECIGH